MKNIQISRASRFLSLFAASAVAFAVVAEPSQPTPKKTVAPRLVGANLFAAGEVTVLASINEYGFVTDAEIAASDNAALNQSTLDAIHEWTFTPAMDDGRPVAAKVVQPFYFNRGAIVIAEKKPNDRLPKAKTTVQPVIGAELESITGEVVLMANLDSEGRVQGVEIKSSTHSELELSASAALMQWTFRPATKAGEAVASKVIIPFRYEGVPAARAVAFRSAGEAKALDKAPVAVRQPTPELPKSLVAERAEATLQLTVDEHGYVADVEILSSSNETLGTAAREAALQWKFKPAIKDGVAVAAKVVQPFSFNGGLLMADAPVDRMPAVKTSKTPELPKALVGVQGYVKVRLNLDAQGNVTSASGAKSSHDELVAPTLEAARSWKFKPALRAGEEVPSSVIVPFVFNAKS